MGPGPETARQPGSDIRTQLAKKKILQFGVDFFYYRVVLFVLFKLQRLMQPRSEFFVMSGLVETVKELFFKLIK